MLGGVCAAAAPAERTSAKLTDLTGGIFHNHVSDLGCQHIGRQMRGEPDADIDGSAGPERHWRAFRMKRLALPADVKLELIALLLDADAGGMESLRPLFIGTQPRLPGGAVFDIGHLAAFFRAPGDMDHAIA